MDVVDIEKAREVLMRHSKSKRNGMFPLAPTHQASMVNPICGDQVELKLVVEDSVVKDAGFQATACAICSASASILIEQVIGWKANEVELKRDRFTQTLLQSESQDWPSDLSEFSSFQNLRVNPRRRACAILPWLALTKALVANT